MLNIESGFVYPVHWDLNQQSPFPDWILLTKPFQQCEWKKNICNFWKIIIQNILASWQCIDTNNGNKLRNEKKKNQSYCYIIGMQTTAVFSCPHHNDSNNVVLFFLFLFFPIYANICIVNVNSNHSSQRNVTIFLLFLKYHIFSMNSAAKFNVIKHCTYVSSKNYAQQNQ